MEKALEPAMVNVLRLRKSHRNLAILCLIFFLGMMIGTAYLALSDGNILGSLFVGGFWGFWVVASLMMLVSYYRESLSVQDGKIVHTGVVRTRELAFAKVVNVRWQVAPRGGSVVLRTSADKVKLVFDNFELEQRRWLIQSLHLSLPKSIQQDWERFCLRIALPLLKPDTDAPLQPGEIWVTRRRWDRFFLFTTVVLVALGIVCAWWFRSLGLLALPLASLLLWPLMRLSTPTKGMRERKVNTAPEWKFFSFMLLWAIVAVAGAILFSECHPFWFGVLLVLCISGMCYSAHQLDCRRRTVENTAAPAAAEEWERLAGVEVGESQG